MSATEKITEALPISELEQRDVMKLYDDMRRGKAKLVGPVGELKKLPDSLYSFLVELIALLNEGHCVYIVQNQSKLTTVEAATMLGVSRQFFVNLLEKGDIAYHMVGTHRRIYAHDLVQYKARRDGQRRSMLKDLVDAEVSEGLYSKIPSLNED